MEEQRPKVGIGVYVMKDGMLLLGRRKGSHGQGEYATPGGHLEYMESFEACAKRETLEETGMEIMNIKFLCLANVKEYAPKHYVHVCVTADWQRGEPKIMEPHKTEDWNWYDMNNLPQPLFKTIPIELEAYRTGKNYFDS